MTYKESIYFIPSVKAKYKDIMLFFSPFGHNFEVFKRLYEIKKEIYKYEFEEWKRDKLWEYINDDIEYNELFKFV